MYNHEVLTQSKDTYKTLIRDTACYSAKIFNLKDGTEYYCINLITYLNREGILSHFKEFNLEVDDVETKYL